MSQALIKRRSLLQQLGAAAFLATPVFRSALAEAQTQFPLRLILLNLPGGISQKSEGVPNFYFDTLAKPFASLESDMIIVDNAGAPAAAEISTWYELEGHGGGGRTMFGGKIEGQGCGGPADCGGEEKAYLYGTATTIDQLVAMQFGAKTRFDSLYFGSLWGGGQGDTIFRNGQRIKPEGDPAATFSKLFGNGAPPPATSTPAPMASALPPDPETAVLYALGKSRLDQLSAEIVEIKGIAGKYEQTKLDLHLTSLRELEKSLAVPGSAGGGGPGATPGGSCTAPVIPSGANMAGLDPATQGDLPAVSAAFNALGYQALNCDLTRVLCLQWLASGDGLVPRFGFMGLKDVHHGWEHSDQVSNPNSQGSREYDAAQMWLFGQMANFITLLKTTPEGSGTMLDNSIIYMSSEMTNGNHIHSPVLQFVAGKGGGAFKTGRRIDATGKNNNDVLLTLANTMGLNLPFMGDQKYNTGALSLG